MFLSRISGQKLVKELGPPRQLYGARNASQARMAVWQDELLVFATLKDSGISLNDFLVIESSSESNWCLRMKTLWFQITDRFANSMIRFMIRFLSEQVASDWIFHFTLLLFEMNSRLSSKCNNRQIFCQDFTLYHHSYP